ncbi:hypothetical protein PMAYCL1PPCAC_13187, partial [Pristionchus mayeri]
SSSTPSTSWEIPKHGTSTVNNSEKREFSVEEDWKIFKRLKEQVEKDAHRNHDIVPKWLEHRYSPEKWKKLSTVEKWRLRRESKCDGSLNATTANDLLAKKGEKSSKISQTLGNMPIHSFPTLLEEDKNSGVLRRLDLFEEEGVAGDDDDAGERTKGLPDWAVPKDRLLRSFFQFRAELDVRTEERLLRDSFMIFDDDPIMRADHPENKPAKPEVFQLKPLKMTTVEWDDWKKEKPIPVLRNVNPSHEMVKDRSRCKGRFAKYSEYNIRPSEIAKLRDRGVSEEDPLFFWNRSSDCDSLEGRSYYYVNEFHRTTKLAKLAIAMLRKKGTALTKEAIEQRMREFDTKLSAMKRKMTMTKKEKTIEEPEEDEETAPTTSKAAEPITVAIPKEEIKKESQSGDVLSPDSPNKRVLPARTRKPTAKEAERREDERKEKERVARRSRDKCSKEPEQQQTSPTAAASSTAAAPAASTTQDTPEKQRKESIKIRMESVQAAKKKGNQTGESVEEHKRRRGLDFRGEVEEEEIVGRTKEGEEIVLVKRGENGSWSIRFDKPTVEESEKEIKKEKNHSVHDDLSSSEEDDDNIPSTEELVKYHPSELIFFRDRWGEPRLAPRCCLADVRDGQWVACKRPGRNDFMSASLAKRAYEMDLNVAWRHEAANQRICQLHSRLLRTAGEGGNILEEMIPWMGRRKCTEMENQLMGREETTAFAELEKEENKWMNWGKPVSTQILMQRMKEINRKARRLVYALRDRKKRRSAKRVRRVPKGMKKQTRLFEYAKFILERIDIDNLTEAEIASLSGKERRTLAELIRVNKKRLEMERDQMDKMKRKREKREGITRPMTPISCASIAGGASEFERLIGPLIECMVQRPVEDGVKDVRPIKRIRVEQTRKEKKNRVVMKRTTRGRKMSRRKAKIVTLKSGDLLNLTKYRTMKKKMKPMIEEMKSTPEKKERAIESLLGKKIPGLGIAIRKEKKQREYAMLERSERIGVSLTLLNKGKKKIRAEYVIIGVLRDHEVKKATMLRDPFLFLAYPKNEKTRKIVKLMPVLPQNVMRNVKGRGKKGIDVVDLTNEKNEGEGKSRQGSSEKRKDDGDEPMEMNENEEGPAKTGNGEGEKEVVVLGVTKKAKRKRWIRKSIDRRNRMYTRPGVIVVRRRETLEQLAEVKAICLRKIQNLPNFDKMLDDIVEKSLKLLCTEPAPRKISHTDVENAMENNYEKRLRELWMEEIDRSLRVSGFLPPNVPDEYLEERAEELEERMKFAIEVEEALLHEERRQRLDDAAAAAVAAIDKDEKDVHANEQSKRTSTHHPLAGDSHSCAPLAAKTSGGKLLQLQSVYDRLKDERTYWNEREDERWRENKPFVPQRHPLLPDEVYDEVSLPVKDGNGKLSSVPKGAVLFETEATARIGRVKTGRKLSLNRALRNIDTSSLTIPQMKKLIAGLKKMKAERARMSGKSSKNKIKKLRMNRVKRKVPRRKEAVPPPSDENNEKEDSEVPLPSQSASLLEWSMAAPSVEEIAKELSEHGKNVKNASEDEIRQSIVRLRQLKKYIYQQFKPLDDGEEAQPTTVKIGVVKTSAVIPMNTSSGHRIILKTADKDQNPMKITKNGKEEKNGREENRSEDRKEEKKQKRKSVSNGEESDRTKKRKREEGEEEREEPKRRKTKEEDRRGEKKEERKGGKNGNGEDKKKEKNEERNREEDENPKKGEKERRKKKEKKDGMKKKEEEKKEETKEKKETRVKKNPSVEEKKSEESPEGNSKQKLYVVRLRKKGSNRKSGSYDWEEKKAIDEEKKRYREQKRAAREGREAMMREEEEEEMETKPVEEPKKRRKKRLADEGILLDDEGKILAKKKRKQVDPTGFSLLPTRSIYRYRDRFGLPKDEEDNRAALVFGAQMHFNKLEGSANAIPYFVHTVKSGGNYLDERDAQQLRKQLERARLEAEQLAAAGLQPATPPPARGTRYRVAANQQKQLLKEAENQEAADNDEDSQ